jgi:hypothetical protein
VFLSEGSSKTLQKTFYKKIASKSVYKKIDKKSQTDFLFSCFSRFWAFIGEGSLKHHKKYKKINLTLVLFWPLTLPPITGVTNFCFGGGRAPLLSVCKCKAVRWQHCRQATAGDLLSARMCCRSFLSPNPLRSVLFSTWLFIGFTGPGRDQTTPSSTQWASFAIYRPN